MRGSGRAYVHGASRRLLDLLATSGWAPLPSREAVGLLDRLWFIEDPVELPADASLMLAHWTAKSHADDLELLFGRRNGERVPDGRFFTCSVVRHSDGWATSPDGGPIVGDHLLPICVAGFEDTPRRCGLAPHPG